MVSSIPGALGTQKDKRVCKAGDKARPGARLVKEALEFKSDSVPPCRES